MRRSRLTNPPNSKSATGPSKVRLSKFFRDLANNTPNDSQFQTKKRVNTKKKRKKKPVTKEPDTGWSGIV